MYSIKLRRISAFHPLYKIFGSRRVVAVERSHLTSSQLINLGVGEREGGVANVTLSPVQDHKKTVCNSDIELNQAGTICQAN